MLAFIVAVPSQAADNDNQVERSMAFVEQTIEATELLNDGQVEQALAAFQELLASFGDLDEDGFVAMAVGDCLRKLDRLDEARAVYESAEVSHPELAKRVDERLTEVELAGTVTEKLLDKLRRAANTSDDNRFASAWYLGRGLQKRAHDMLDEALDAFAQATSPGSPIHRHAIKPFNNAHLEELTLQLGSLIDQLEKRWRTVPESAGNCASIEDDRQSGAMTTLNRHSEWTVTSPDGRRIAFEMKQDNDGPYAITADGKPVTLTEVQTALIRQHQDRINAILIEALTTQSSSQERREQ